MLLREYGIQIFEHKKKAIFIATTQPLVLQQSEEIKKHLGSNYKVRAFYGDNGANTWDQAKWSNEIDSHDVLVITPDIFYDVLSKQMIGLDQICVLIFDEAHWGGPKRKGTYGNRRLKRTFKRNF